MKILLFFIVLYLPIFLYAQQVADTSYKPFIKNPAYKPGNGPIVFIDGAHHNFHTKNGRYSPFSSVLEMDGYQVKSFDAVFTKKELSKGKIMVIANALNEINVQNWYLPTPSAFTIAEIEEMKQWVYQGGSLFLIADHMPMAGAAKDMAEVFGFEFSNGFVIDTTSQSSSSLFRFTDNTLRKSIITKGRNSQESVNQVATYTGQAFRLPDDAIPILVFDKRYINLLPDTAWVFNDKTTKFSAEGWSQGGFKKYGKGKIVVFGEAAMFTAQLAGPQGRKVGMNDQNAADNYKLLLNIIHWLDGKLN